MSENTSTILQNVIDAWPVLVTVATVAVGGYLKLNTLGIRLDHIEAEQKRDREKFKEIYNEINQVNNRLTRIETHLFNGKKES